MKETKLFGKVLLNNKTYLIILVGEDRVLFAKEDNGQVNPCLNDEEFKQMRQILSSLIINKEDSVFVSNRMVNQTLYHVFYDIHSDLFYWEDDNGNANKPFDNLILNNRYNCIPDVIYNKTIQEPKNKTLQRWIRRQQIKDALKFGIPSTIMLTASIVMTVLVGRHLIRVDNVKAAQPEPSYAIVEQYEVPTSNEPFEYNIIDEWREDWEKPRDFIGFEQIKSIIEKNPNIDSATKEFLYNLDFIFAPEYQKHMQMDEILKRLTTLDIKYRLGEQKIDSWGGVYFFSDNKIEIYVDDNFDINNTQTVACLLHEFFHVLQVGSCDTYIYELSNELFTVEAIRTLINNGILDSTLYPHGVWATGYVDHVEYYEYLATIIPRDFLIHYQFNPISDKQHINAIPTEPLRSLDPNKSYKKVAKLLADLEDLEGDLFSKNPDIIDQISFYYNLKYGREIKDDLYTVLIGQLFYINPNSNIEEIYLMKWEFLLEHIGLSFSDISYISNIHSNKPTYFSDAYSEFPSVSFEVVITKDGKELSHAEYTICITPGLQIKYENWLKSLDNSSHQIE